MAQGGSADARRARRTAAGIFHTVEQLFYVAIAIALALAGIVLFAWTSYSFATRWARVTSPPPCSRSSTSCSWSLSSPS